MKDKSKYLSVVIPAYNEELRIGKTLSDAYSYLSEHFSFFEIIVVDDEETFVSIIEDLFEKEQIEVKGFTDGQEAIDYFKKESKNINVIVTDIMMPGIKGTELIPIVKEIDPYVQVVAVTGFPSQGLIENLLKAGVNDIIIKPCQVNDIKKNYIK